jgi:hypothetical protein
MTTFRLTPCRPAPALLALLGSLALSGCAALTNPVADGIPVRRLPPELLAISKKEYRPTPLSLLRQKPSDLYKLDAGDVLGVWIDGFLGKEDQGIPLATIEPALPPALGYPVVVQEGGIITLPSLKGPLKVKDLTITKAQQLVRNTYLDEKLINAGARVLVTLQRRRRSHILVVRMDSAGPTGGTPSPFGIGSIGVAAGTSGRGTGTVLDLPAYENDVMNALTSTGGLPGFGAADEVIVERGGYRAGGDAAAAAERLKNGPPGAANGSTKVTDSGAQVVRIPLRLRKGQPPPFTEQDIILHTGDVVYIPSRDAEVFYTGGLSFTGQYQLPRNYDLGVVEALALTRGTLVNGGIASLNNFSGNSFGGGTIGAPNPSLISVLRRLPEGGQVTIAVNLNRALRDPRENLVIMPNDILIYQFSPGEAFVRYLTSVLHLDLLGTIIRQNDLTGTTTLGLP